MSPTKYLLLFLGVVVFTTATCSFADDHYKPPYNPGDPKKPPIHKPPYNPGDPKKPPIHKPPIHKPPTVPHDHDDERKLTTLSSKEFDEDQRPFGKHPKGKGGKPPHGHFPGHPPKLEKDNDVNKDGYKPPYKPPHKPPHKPPQPPHKPPHKPPSTN